MITSAALNIMRSLSLIVIATAILVSLHIAKVSVDGLWLQTFLNSLHVMVFAIVALLILAATKALPNLSTTRRTVITLLTTLILGIVSEAAQLSGPRDASLEDLLSNWLGAAGALLIAVAFVSETQAHRTSRILVSLAGFAVLVIALLPLLNVSAAFVERYFQKPTLITFDSFFAGTFVRPQNSTLTVVKPPSDGETIGRVSLAEGAWPGLIIHDIWPDWSSYSEIVVELVLKADTPLSINFRVHDRQHQVGEQPYNDRFNLTRELQPGRHTLRIPLETIKQAPTGRQMDLANIAGIVIFCSRTEAGREFGLISISLQ